MTMVLSVALAVLLTMATQVGAHINPCTRACAVVFTRGRSNCQIKVKASIKKRQKQCKTDFSGFTSVGKCRSAAAQFGKTLITGVCKGSSKDACLMCCSNGGTKDTCAPRSPSGAFLDLAGPLF